MTSEFEQLVRASIRGVAFIKHGEHGLAFSRLPEWTYAQHNHEPIVAKMVERLSGSHLDLLTAATTLTVTYRSLRDQDIQSGWLAGPSVISVTTADFAQSIAHENGDLRVWNGPDIQELRSGENSVAEFTLPGADSPRLVQVWLPQNCPIELISIDADQPVQAASISDKPKWVHYGSSISHCEDSDTPLGVWPVAASRALGFEIYNLGMGGCANLEQFSARTIRDLPADLISLKLGINVVNSANHTSRTFGPAVHGFIDTIREAKPTTPILVISPVCCPAHENNPGPSETSPEGMVMGQPFSRHSWIGELTLRSIRVILSELVAQRAESDPNIFYMNGLELFDEIEAPTMPDGIHPDAAGYLRIADNFVARHPREWVEAVK